MSVFSILHQSWLLCAFCVMQTAESAPEQVSNCKSCGKQVFQMEQIKAERAVWHKNCFRCTECNKQLTWVPFRWCLGALELWQVVKIGSHVGICLEGWKFYLLYLNISSHLCPLYLKRNIFLLWIQRITLKVQDNSIIFIIS